MKKILIYIWQLPQNLLGLVMLIFFRVSDKTSEMKTMGVLVCFADSMRGGISLGRYIFLSSMYCGRSCEDKTVNHELGHCRQSMRLGWLYLPIIGLPSIIHACLYKYEPSNPDGYYNFWTEAWADRLGGVRRKIKTGIK